MNAFTPRGWCPGLARPMMSGDGLLVRLRPAGTALSRPQLAALADCAENFGNGLIDLTSRGNLQLRGIQETALDDLAARLVRHDLAPRDGTRDPPAGIFTSPLAGLDATARLDIRPVEAALSAALSQEEFAGLPAKFSILLDDGGACPLGGAAADIRLEASVHADVAQFALRLGGVSDRARFAGLCAVRDAAAVTLQITRRFMRTGPADGTRPQRMRGLRTDGIAGLNTAPAPPPRALTSAHDIIGAPTLGGGNYLGVSPPFGRLDGAMLRALAAALMQAGAAALRVTPWRALLIPCVPTALARTRAALAGAGLITDPQDPLLRVAACSGLHACASATTDVRAHARALAPLAARLPGTAVALHVSGCVKGCAHPGAAPVTLAGRAGLYDFIAPGTARDAPQLCNLTPGAAEAALARLVPGGHLERAAQ